MPYHRERQIVVEQHDKKLALTPALRIVTLMKWVVYYLLGVFSITRNRTSNYLALAWIFSVCVSLAPYAYATDVPNSADINRVLPEQRPSLSSPQKEADVAVPAYPTPNTPVPQGASKIRFVLRDVRLQGVTVFKEEEVKKLYTPVIGKQISLDMVWRMAEALTVYYQNSGYFLSRAFVPAQEIGNGIITLKVVEGYIGEIELDGQPSNPWVVRHILKNIQAERPITLKTLESQVLLLNDIPDFGFGVTIKPLSTPANDGAVKLIVTSTDKPSYSASASIDNFGSRYLGPLEDSAVWKGILIPGQETTLSGLTSIPNHELKSFNLAHHIPVLPRLVLEVSGSYTEAVPGYTLKTQEVESSASNVSIGTTYQFIRQRQENLKGKISFDVRNSNSDILDSALSRDRIRAVRASLNYDRADKFSGYNYASATVSQGITSLGANSESDANISRSGAEATFTKAVISYNRLQSINNNWSALLSTSAQRADDSLYSSEEFGFGGQSFGRAYDSSELSGDDGIAGAIELRYHNVPEWHKIVFVPYGFIDAGKVWNKNSGQASSAAGASAGSGVRLQHANGLSGNFAIAEPLERPRETLFYGQNGMNPRLLMQLNYAF